jgi:hypothetical protein
MQTATIYSWCHAEFAAKLFPVCVGSALQGSKRYCVTSGATFDAAFTMSNSARLRAARFRLRWSFGAQVGGQAPIIPQSAPRVAGPRSPEFGRMQRPFAGWIIAGAAAIAIEPHHVSP